MKESKEVKVFRVDYKCPKCNEGYLRPTAQSLPTYPTAYIHKCNNGECDYEDILSEIYPCIEYREL